MLLQDSRLFEKHSESVFFELAWDFMHALFGLNEISYCRVTINKGRPPNNSNNLKNNNSNNKNIPAVRVRLDEYQIGPLYPVGLA